MVMDYIHNLRENTTTLTQAVGILQGTRWDATQEQARQYLISVDMDLAFASGLVADMEADNFAQTLLNIASGAYAKTNYKSIAIWVRKFGFEATLAPSGDFWEISLPRWQCITKHTVGLASFGMMACATALNRRIM